MLKQEKSNESDSHQKEENYIQKIEWILSEELHSIFQKNTLKSDFIIVKAKSYCEYDGK